MSSCGTRRGRTMRGSSATCMRTRWSSRTGTARPPSSTWNTSSPSGSSHDSRRGLPPVRRGRQPGPIPNHPGGATVPFCPPVACGFRVGHVARGADVSRVLLSARGHDGGPHLQGGRMGRAGQAFECYRKGPVPPVRAMPCHRLLPPAPPRPPPPPPRGGPPPPPAGGPPPPPPPPSPPPPRAKKGGGGAPAPAG